MFIELLPSNGRGIHRQAHRQASYNYSNVAYIHCRGSVPKVYYHVYISPFIFNHLNLVHSLAACLFKNPFNIILESGHRLPKHFQGFQLKLLYTFPSLKSVLYICLAHSLCYFHCNLVKGANYVATHYAIYPPSCFTLHLIYTSGL
jgi:hypothetical protein